MSERTTVDKILMDRIDRDDTVDDRIKAAIRAHIQKVTGTLGKRMAHTIDIQALALAQSDSQRDIIGIGFDPVHPRSHPNSGSRPNTNQ